MQEQTLKEWETSLSHVRDLYLEELRDDGKLHLRLGQGWLAGEPEPEGRWVVLFQDAVAYRNWDEAYHTELWQAKPTGCGWTFEIENSRWIAAMREDPFFEHHVWGMGAVRHFVVSTLDDVVEVLSRDPPSIVFEP